MECGKCFVLSSSFQDVFTGSGRIVNGNSPPATETVTTSNSSEGSGTYIQPFEFDAEFVLNGAQIVLYLFTDASNVDTGFNVSYWYVQVSCFNFPICLFVQLLKLKSLSLFEQHQSCVLPGLVGVWTTALVMGIARRIPGSAHVTWDGWGSTASTQHAPMTAAAMERVVGPS